MCADTPSIQPVTLRIKAGQGITYALLDLVKDQKMDLSNGKITTREWNSVMDKLVEIQNNRAADGKASVFSGGTDKTGAGYKNSFIVHEGQEIEFTQEEIGELYEAMGAKFTNSSKPCAPKTPVLNNPPKTDIPPQTSPVPPGGKDESKLLKKVSPLAEDLLLPHTSCKNITVLNPDGTSYTYNKKGYITKIQDAHGHVIQELYRNENGTISGRYDFEYDEHGNMTRGISTDLDGNIACYNDYQYNSKGNKTGEEYVSYGSSWNVLTHCYTEYDENQNKVRSTFYKDDGSVNFYLEYENDTDRNTLREIWRNEDGSLDYYEECIGFERVKYNPDGTVRE